MNNKTLSEEEDLQLSTLFTTWLKDQDHSPATVRNYQSDLNHFKRWFEQANAEPLSPAQLTPTDVREYRQHMLSVERRKASTINRRLSALSAYSRWAQEAGFLDYNPTDRVQTVSIQPRAPRWLDKKEQASLLRELELLRNAARTDHARFRALRDQTVVILMLNTGLRIGEVCNLVVSDLLITARKGQLLVREGKGGKQRFVPLNLEARRVIGEWLPERAVWLTNLDMQEAHLFITHLGERLGSRSIQKMITQVGQRAGISLSCHALRHTFAKNLVNAGVSLEKVAALLGHSNLNTTRVYIVPGQQDLERAVEALV
ncbi:MAG: tyrosine-type recombinase/integrase [Anaerolineales bacterium]|nr:tyrosine-type recombinase/integrase [Anaerolineales bacterium]